MHNRRYDEAEVRRIMELATTQPETGRRAAIAHGLTLAEVQSIGSEIGVDGAAIERAAAALDMVPESPPRRSLGMRIEVNHQAPLPRPPTDAEWARIVSDLRATFRAQGAVTTGAGVWEWRNGNLFACVEPSVVGYRMRLGTLKRDAHAVNALGATGLAAGAAVFASMLATGGALIVPMIFGASGTAAFLANLLRLPRWAEQRERQMAQVAARSEALLRTPAVAE
jgi:hypothetical protein